MPSSQLVVDNWRSAPEGSGIDFLWTGRTEFQVTTLPQRSPAPTGTPPPHDHHEGGEGSDSPGSGLDVEFGEGSGESASSLPGRSNASSSNDRSRSRPLAVEGDLRTSELWQPIQGLCNRPFGPLTSFATTGWLQASDTCLTASFPSRTGVEMLVAWDQAGILQALEFVGWRMLSCTANGSIHFAIESTSDVGAPISLVALTDILFLTYLRTLEVTAGVTALRPHDVVVAKVKSVTGLSVLICLPSTTTLGIIHHAWLLATAWTDVEPSIRLVVHARQAMPHIPIAHVAINGRCTVNTLLPIQGGGPIRNRDTGLVGSAGKGHHHVKARLAQALLDDKFPPKRISTLVKRLCDAVPQEAIQTIFAEDANQTSIEKIRALAKQHGVQLTEQSLEGPGPQAKSKTEATSSKQSKGAARIAVEEFCLVDGYFAFEDDTPCPVVQELTRGTSGVMLCRLDQIADWVKAGTLLAEPFGALLISTPPLPLPLGFRCEQVNFPATNKHGLQFILRGCLLQMGEGSVKPALPNHQTTQISLKTMHCTLSSDDFGDMEWQTICEAPVKKTLARIGPLMENPKAVKSVWGRSFRCGGRAVPAREASSVRFHMSIEASLAEPVLRVSGSCKVDIAIVDPKTGKPDQLYAITWCKVHTRPEMEAILNKISAHFGYVRGKNGYGVRTAFSAAEDTWKTCRPSEPFHPAVKSNHLYRLSGADPTTDFGTLEELASQLKWNMKPIRKLRAGAWILAAETKCASHTVLLNGRPLLLQEIPPKLPGTTTVVAGNLQAHRRAHSGALSSNASATSDPWQHGSDPWQTGPVGQPQPQRSVPGPVESKMNAQDAKIASLEQRIQGLHDATNSIQESQKAHAEATKQEVSTVYREIRALSDKTDTQMTTLAAMFANQLKESLANQSAELLRAMKQERRPSEPAGSEDQEAKRSKGQ